MGLAQGVQDLQNPQRSVTEVSGQQFYMAAALEVPDKTNTRALKTLTLWAKELRRCRWSLTSLME